MKGYPEGSSLTWPGALMIRLRLAEAGSSWHHLSKCIRERTLDSHILVADQRFGVRLVAC